MVWENEESCESWLVDFGLGAKSEFTFVFLTQHYGFTDYFE